MNPENLYDKRIKDLEREIRNLKTTHFKTATTISTITENVGLNFSLMLDQMSGNVFSDKRAIISVVTNDGSDMISACYVLNATPDNLDDRFIQILRLKPSNGAVRFGVAVLSQNTDDWNTLWGGGSVNLNYTVQVVGSSKFSLQVTYKNITGGTL